MTVAEISFERGAPNNNSTASCICVRCAAPLNGNGWECARCKHYPETIDGFLTLAPEIKDSEECYAMEIIDELATLEAQNFWFRSRNKLIIWALKKHFPNLQSFFEIGCGNGFVLQGINQAFPLARVIGADAMIQCLAYAKERVPDAEMYQVDARNLPFKNSFQVAGIFDVIEHIEEDDLVLKEIYEALEVGGGVFLTVPRYMWLWSPCDDFVRHVRRYEPGELERKVERAGFKVVQSTCFVSLLLPLLIFSRIRQHLSPRPYSLMNELRVQGFVGGILEKAMDFERFLMRCGLNLPVGGSLLVVAKKC